MKKNTFFNKKEIGILMQKYGQKNVNHTSFILFT